MEDREPPDLLRLLARTLLYLGLLALVLRTAWISDDARISFRTILNFVHGFGLRYNPIERVQTFTHPLWVLVCSAGRWLTGELHLTVLAISLVCSLGAFAILERVVGRRGAWGWIACLALLGSKAWLDYTTSALENPLSYLLVAACFAVAAESDRCPRLRLGGVTALAALVFVNRMDLVLVVAPLVLWSAWELGSPRRAAAPLLVGSLPALAWLGFSLLYYGVPFPNTAYAKLQTGIPRSEYLAQGLLYYLESLDRDPITLLVLATSLVAGIRFGRGPDRALGTGIGAYLAYTLWIGGDFMSGRFFSVPLLATALLIARFPPVPGPAAAGVAVLVVALGLLSRGANLRSDSTYLEHHREHRWPPHLIVDERAYYWDETRLLDRKRSGFRQPAWPDAPARELRPSDFKVDLTTAAGQPGLEAGPYAHQVDYFGLLDPLVARIPMRPNPAWRIGHIERFIPEGYVETLKSGVNRIVDQGLAEYWDKLRIVTRDPVFDRRRLRTVLALNLGMFEHHLKRSGPKEDAAKVPGLGETRVALETLSIPKPSGSPWDAPGNAVFPSRLLVLLESRRTGARVLDVSLDNNDLYSLEFRDGSRIVAALEAECEVLAGGGLRRQRIELPEPATEMGFDRILIRPIWGDGKYSVGHLLLE